MELAIANVCRVDIITDETTPIKVHITTSDEVGCEPKISEGKEEELRSKNRILAQNITEDLVKGYDLSMKDTVVNPDQFALLDGGTITWDEDHEQFIYEGPESGAAIARKSFTCDIYTEEKDGDGETLGYQRFRFRHCKGKPVKFSMKDGSFFAPEYNIRSRAKSGERPVEIMSFDHLPADTLTAAALLAYNTQTTGA